MAGTSKTTREQLSDAARRFAHAFEYAQHDSAVADSETALLQAAVAYAADAARALGRLRALGLSPAPGEDPLAALAELVLGAKP